MVPMHGKKAEEAFHEPTRSAGCQPAVSPTASRRSVEQYSNSAPCERPAGWQPAKRQTGQSAPLSKRGSRSLCMRKKAERGLSMHRKVAQASRVPLECDRVRGGLMQTARSVWTAARFTADFGRKNNPSRARLECQPLPYLDFASRRRSRKNPVPLRR